METSDDQVSWNRCSHTVSSACSVFTGSEMSGTRRRWVLTQAQTHNTANLRESRLKATFTHLNLWRREKRTCKLACGNRKWNSSAPKGGGWNPALNRVGHCSASRRVLALTIWTRYKLSRFNSEQVHLTLKTQRGRFNQLWRHENTDTLATTSSVTRR